MREQVIYLDPADDHIATRDRIGWSQAERILLVWPAANGQRRPLTRKVDLVLVQRHAQRMGAELGLITDDPDIADHAHDLGLPIFDSIDDAHLFDWPRPRDRTVPPPPDRAPPYDPDVDDPILDLKPPKWLNNPWLKRTGSALVFSATLAVLLLMLALTVPHATLTLTPQGQQIVTRVPITAAPALDLPNPTAGLIPAEIRRTIVTNSITINTTGAIDRATQRAGGYVTFTNQTSQPVRIPAGTAVRTSTGIVTVRFVTQQDVELRGEIGATVEAPILAVDPGPLGNVAANLVNQVEGPLSISVAVTNPRPTTGGDVVQVAAIAAADRDLALEQLTEQLKHQGYANLQATLTENEFAPETTVRILRTLERTFSGNIGDQADTLTLTMRAEIGVTVVDETEAFPLARTELFNRAGTVLVLLPDSITLERTDPITTDDDYRVSFEVLAQGYAATVIDPAAVQQAVAWQPPEDALRMLQSVLPLATPPTVSVWPGWFPRLPWLPYQIEVIIIPTLPEEPVNAPSGN